MASAGSQPADRASSDGRSTGKRILIVVQNLPVPFDRRVWLESTSLVKEGYEVSVICPKLKGYTKSREQLEGVEIYRYNMPFDPTSKAGFFGEFSWALLRVLILSFIVQFRGKGFDVIHACNPPETYWVIGRFWNLFGKKYLFDHHDLSPEMYEAKFGEGGALYKGLLWLERMTFKTADACITTNESHKRLAVERGGMDADDVYVVRSGPDLARFQVYEPDPKWRNGAEHAIAYLGDISDQDGVDLLVQAMAVLKNRGRDDIHCVVIGGGSAWEDVKQLAVTEGVDDRMTFTGTVSDEDLCRILSSVDVGVDPVPKNNWSDKSTMNKIVEYMYFGLPVVAFDLTEARFSARDAGRFAEPNDVDALATTITDVLDDDVARKAMSAYGSKRLREELAWEHSIPPLVAAYEKIL